MKSHFSVRSITREGLDLRERVVDMVNSGSWNFPNTWLDLFPALIFHDIPIFSNREDQVLWRKSDGNSHYFAVKLVWESIRPRG